MLRLSAVATFLAVVGGFGCTRSTGPVPLGAVLPGADAVAVMRLRPHAAVTSCRRWFAGITLQADPNDGLQRLLATEPEANVLSEASLELEEFSVGPYVRHCMTIRGVLARTIRTVTIPSGDAMEGHHHHH